MWSFTLSNKRRNGRRAAVTTATAFLAAGSLLATASPAHADTIGGYPVSGSGVLQELGGLLTGGIFNFDATFTPVNLTGAIYAFVRNDYLGVAMGTTGSYTVNYGDPGLGSVAYAVPGRIAFHTREGSLITAADDFRPLNGFNLGSGLPGYPVSPLAGSAVVPERFYYDYPSYVTIIVNGAARNLGFADADRISTRFVDNKIVTDYLALAGTTGNVTIRQTIELVRSKARLQWEIVNNDTLSHTVGLRFSTNILDIEGSNQQGQSVNEAFFVDPTVGQTNRRQLYTSANIPTHIDVLRRRAPILAPPVNEPFLHVRQVLRGFDATPPDRVHVVDSGYFIPERNTGFFIDPADPALIENFDDGIATGLYWDQQPLQPGGRRVIVTYYGVGTATEELSSFGNLSYVVGTEAIESLSLNTAAVTDPVVQANKSAAQLGSNPNIPQENVATRFYTPNRIQVFGTLYNRTLPDPQFQVPITNVNMTLNLPSGLRFAVADPNTTVRDTPLKTLGDAAADKDVRTSWFIEPTGEVYGSLAYTLSVQTGNAGSKSLSRVINVPATPLKRVTAANFQMISFPFEFDPNLSNNGDPNTVINGITRPTDPNIHFLRWIPNSQSLTGEGGYQRVDRLVPGESYFYRASFDRVIFANGVYPTPNQAPIDVAGQTKVIQIQRGWNMIGNPYVYEIPLNFLQLVRSENLLEVYSFTEAVNAGLVRGGVFTFNPARGDYDFFERFDAPIRPWEGYWVYADSDLLLKFLAPPQINAAVVGPTPVPGNPTGGVTRKPVNQAKGAIASRAALVAKPTMNEWKLQIIARRKDGFEDAAALVGVSRSAKDGDDMRDLPKPPVPYSNFVYVGLVRSGASSRYAQDMRAPGGTKKWEVEVTTDQEGPITLSWPNTATLPRRLRLSVKDLTTGRVTNLRGASSLTVNMSKDTPRRFEVTAQPAASQPLSITNARVSSTRCGGYAFAFNVNQDATVSGRVLTLSGKLAAPIATGRSVSVGENRLNWNGRAADGAALPAGAYLVEIKATTDEGEPVIVKRPLQLIR